MGKSKHPEHPLVIVRTEIGKTQADFAEILDVSSNYLSMIVNGKDNKVVTRNLAEKIHDKYGYNIDWLMGRSIYKTDEEALSHVPRKFKSELDFEKDWIRQGGGAHPLNNQIVVEARIGVALEKLNENGWRIAVNMIESLCNIPEFQTKEENNKGGNLNREK